jgi:hypothetical protein
MASNDAGGGRSGMRTGGILLGASAGDGQSDPAIYGTVAGQWISFSGNRCSGLTG